MTSVKIEPIKPKHNPFDTAKMKRAIENAGNMTAKAIEVDFHVTTRTWKHQPAFGIEHSAGKLVWVIATDDTIYGYISEGTRAHVIVPRNAKRLVFFRSGFRPKSRVGWIGSNQGARAGKDKTFAKMVHHPGTKARDYPKVIKKKWDQEWPRQLARAIRAAVKYGGG